MLNMPDFSESDIHIEKRNGGWYVVWRRPGYPPRMMTSNLTLSEAQRAEDRGELTVAAKLRKAAAEARDKNDLDLD
jgi:hypothetical protein